MQRTRYNAKARSGSHKKKAKRGKDRQDLGQPDQPNPNAEVVVPKSEEQRAEERKRKMREEMLAELDSKASSKKKKRLEKYIEKKLKQEERFELFEKLSKSQVQGSAALNLQSSATLGTGKASTHRNRLEKEEDLEVKRAMDGRANKGKRRRLNEPLIPLIGDSDDSDVDLKDTKMDVGARSDSVHEDEDVQEGMSRSKPVVIVDSGFSTTVQSPETDHPAPAPSNIAVGSALRHNPDGTVVAPKISKRTPKHSKTAFSSWNGRPTKRARHESEDSDSSFDSSDSAYDSVSEDEEDQASDAGDVSDDSDSAESEASLESSPKEYSEEQPEGSASKKRKKLGFKDWAMKQLSAAKGYVAPPPDETNNSESLPTQTASAPRERKIKHVDGPREMRGPLGEDLHLPQTSFAQRLQESAKDSTKPKTRKVITVTRPPEVEEARLLLPIVAEEQPIMEAILLHSVVIICGETGSGKTTQVPQFLFEAGFGSAGSDNPGMIGVTQPRRVAAMSMASRVAHELSLTSTRVSYQIRYDATVSPSTAIKFMTDGVLLRELATDFLLKKYSVIIIDEAHERSMNTDILIGVLSRVVKLREEMWKDGQDDIKPLRLIIMSATLRVTDFAENKSLFSSPPPIINVPARQHPVTVHFSRRTSSDYVSEAIKKASKIHARLPPGGILIFLTGQNEITGVCRRLEGRYGKKALEERKKARTSLQSRLSNLATSLAEDKPASRAVAPAHADVEAEDVDLGDSQQQEEALAFDVDGIADADAEALDSDDEAEANEELGIDAEETDVPMHIVPLYALLSSEKQMQVFKPPPPGTRLVVVATNVAETSLTIPGIRYVVDCGRAKERRYDVANGIQAFRVSWISKASAAQRAGRAGRTGPGHCYRLYSSALFEHYFEPFSQPEILRMPIEGVVLQMKSMHIDAVVNFPFPTPPDRASLQKAEKVLTHLGALAPAPGAATLGGSITDVGRTMSLFPLSPRFSRMLVSGRQHGCLPYVITIVAALSVGDPFLREEALEVDKDEEDAGEDEDEELAHLTSEAVRAKEARRVRRKAFFQSQQLHAALGGSSSDVLRVLSVVGAYEYAGGGHKFCEEHFVRPKACPSYSPHCAMEEIHKLRAQISSIVQTNFPDVRTGFEANLPPPSALQLKVLRQLIAAGFIDQVAVRKDVAQKGWGAGASGGTQYTTARGVAYEALGIGEDVYVHPASVLAGQPPPEYVVFLEVVRTSRVYIKGLTVVNGAWLHALGKALCTYSKPFINKEGQSMVIPHFGPQGWELPPIPESQK
ncbi:P-loop containing nucleoside triphosphate hydrolase protein [Trametes elegans]|nr:P-loop containing nucleoside triphosphate hydrolase protein [Trametes elegans]